MGSQRIAALAICLLVLLPCYSTAENMIYSREKAREYAEKFCNQANSEKFNDYSLPGSGGDCANFASQSIIAGFGGIRIFVFRLGHKTKGPSCKVAEWAFHVFSKDVFT